MNIRRIGIVLAAALFLVNSALAQQSRQAEIDLQAAIRVETVNGDLKAAIKQYGTLIARYSKDRALVASALVRMAGCYQKLGDSESRRIYERVVGEFGDQADAVAIARARLSDAGRDSRGQVSRQVWTGADVDSYGSVSADGRVITYTDWSTGNLALHDLATGQNRPLTDKKDWSSSEYAIGSAISRDGKQVAYTWVLVAPQVPAKDHFAEVRIVGANGGKPRVLFRDPDVRGIHVHEWTPDGKWLAVVLNRRDYTTQIGLMSVADGAVRVLKSVLSGPDTVSRVAVSPDGKYLAFDVAANRHSEQREVRVMTIDAAGEGEALPHPVNDRVLGWSSDGRHLVFASDRSGLSGIWATSVVAGELQGPELIKANVNPKSLGVTRSGVLYYAVVGAGQDIYVGSADFNVGKVIARPAALPATYLGVSDFPSWSPDGKSLAYLAIKNANSRSTMHTSVFVRSMDTGRVRELPHTLSYLLAPDKNRPIWGPDGAFVIVAGQDAEGRYGIYRIQAETGATTPLVVRDRFDVSAHVLSPDGRTLYLKKREPEVRQQVILARDLSSGTERELVRGASLGDVVLSPDGRWLATVAFDGTSSASLLVMAADGGGDARELLRASDPETLGAFVAWLPDSNTLLFRKFTKGARRRGEVWRISIDGNGPREILNGILANPSIHPDGRQFAYAEGNPLLEVWTLENFLPSVKTSR